MVPLDLQPHSRFRSPDHLVVRQAKRSMRMTVRILGGVTLALCCSGVLAAQTSRPTSVDATVGLGYGVGGRYSGRQGVEGAITLVARHRADGIMALTVGGFNSLPYSEKCTIRTDSVTNCAPARFPTLTNVGLLSGLERGRAQGSLRALIGPALFNGRGRSALGGLGQIDATRSWARLAIVFTARGSVFPRSSTETLHLLSLGLGVRVQ